MKVLMENILAFNTETLCSRFVWSLLWVLANFCWLPTPAHCPKRNKSAESPCFCVSMPPRPFSKYTVYSRWWSGGSTREPQTFAPSVLSPSCKDTTVSSAVSWRPHVKCPSLFYWRWSGFSHWAVPRLKDWAAGTSWWESLDLFIRTVFPKTPTTTTNCKMKWVK